MTEEKKKQGFAAMDPERQLELARRGGAAVPADKRSFATNSELARKSGRKGGLAVPAEKRTFSANRELAAEAGRRGAASRRKETNNDSEAQTNESAE